MIRILPIEHVLFTCVMAMLLVACGWAEWPPSNDKPRASNRPERLGPSSSAFVSVISVTVGKGDTVYGLSRRHRVSARAIIDANNLRAPYVISLGQSLILPRARDYVVKRSDSISSIASKYNENTYAIARLNNLHPPYTIYVGQNLFLPNLNRYRPVSTSTPIAPLTKSKLKMAKASSKAKAVLAPPAITGEGFLWPVKGKVLSSYGGKSAGLQNDGINIAAPRGAPVRAAENGVVAYSGNELRGFGNLLLLKHTDGWITAYAHNDSLLVKRGDKIKKGQTIAKVGSSGSVQNPQLHFELRKGKKAIDPIKYLPKV
jgi:murein DD-endopeptidase MepM/ murein hydrolase activator NlpD